jgi:LacI family transcriptional regulator
MNYRPNRMARALATGRTHFVALWVPDIFHPYYVRVMQHVGERLEGTGNELVVYRVPNPFDPAAAFGSADGILVLDYPEVPDRYREFDPHHAPLVNMGVRPNPRVDHVKVDLVPGAADAVRHLIGRGCRRVAYLADTPSFHAGEPRYDAYRDVMREAGREPLLIGTAANSREAARDAVKEYVRAHGGPPDGLFCLSDDLALGAYRGLCDLGLSAPDDAVLVGCDGIAEVEYLERPFGTIALPLAEMCAAAYDLMRRRTEDPTRPAEGVVLRSEFIARTT